MFFIMVGNKYMYDTYQNINNNNTLRYEYS